MKETKIYFLDIEECKDYVNATSIQEWTQFKDLTKGEHKQAKEFVNKAEELGNVYSLSGFMFALNNSWINLDNTFFYVTTES